MKNLDMKPLVCGSTWLVLISTINLIFLSSSSSSSSSRRWTWSGLFGASCTAEVAAGPQNDGCLSSRGCISTNTLHFLPHTYTLPPPTRRNARRKRRIRLLRQEGQPGQDVRFHGANEHQTGSAAHHRMQLKRLISQIPGSTSSRLQKVLISTVSTFDRSSLPSASALSKSARHDAARALRLRPWRCEQPQPHSESYEGANGQMLNTAAGSNGVLRAAGRGKAAAALSSSSCECDEGEKQIGR